MDITNAIATLAAAKVARPTWAPYPNDDVREWTNPITNGLHATLHEWYQEGTLVMEVTVVPDAAQPETHEVRHIRLPHKASRDERDEAVGNLLAEYGITVLKGSGIAHQPE